MAKDKIFLRIKLIPNSGVHAAWNIALSMAESEYFITSDNDIYVPDLESDWLTQMVKFMDKRPDYGAISLCPHVFIGAAGIDPSDPEEVKERMEHELNIIISKGYAPYFLIAQDFVHWAATHGIITNTRGSAAGSLVSFILGITTVNPLTYYLPFERFLTPWRPSPPDIDFDIADGRREEVVNYLINKYENAKIEEIKLDIKRSPAILEFDDKKYNEEIKKCLRIWPQDNDTEGFFVVKILKTK